MLDQAHEGVVAWIVIEPCHARLHRLGQGLAKPCPRSVRRRPSRCDFTDLPDERKLRPARLITTGDSDAPSDGVFSSGLHECSHTRAQLYGKGEGDRTRQISATPV